MATFLDIIIEKGVYVWFPVWITRRGKEGLCTPKPLARERYSKRLKHRWRWRTNMEWSHPKE